MVDLAVKNCLSSTQNSSIIGEQGKQNNTDFSLQCLNEKHTTQYDLVQSFVIFYVIWT